MINKTRIISIISIFIFIAQVVSAQTTGKISGSVLDKELREPLIGANVLIEELSIGAAVDPEGDYYIINIPPGKYTVKVSMIGYSPMIFKDVVVSVNRTISLNAELQSEDITLKEVVVSVQGVARKKDQTSSVKNISADQITQLAVESVEDILDMQAGVIDGHFRGGRTTEVSYLVDGVSMTEGFNRTSNSITIETEAVQDLEVITGIFNAEYGRAMSGIVNIVTKEGSNIFGANVSSSLSNYYTANDNIFMGLNSNEVTRNQDYKIQFEGPIYNNYITFFTNFRYQNNQGHLNGIRRFLVNDYSNFGNRNFLGETSTPWDAFVNDAKYYSEFRGDNEFVAMEQNKSTSFIGKLTFRPFNSIKASFLYTVGSGKQQYYNHYYKYKPDGRKAYYSESDLFMFQINHVISKSIFHDLKLSYKRSTNEDYLYEDPFDSRYVSINYNSSAGGFSSGGQDLGYNGIKLNDFNAKYDFTWQINKHHSIKSGFNYTKYDLTKITTIVRDKKFGTSSLQDFTYDSDQARIIFNDFEPEILDSSVFSDNYSKSPYELSAYMQDKMEYDDLVINYGVRYDYFNSNTLFPTQLRNPANQLSFPNNPERVSKFVKSESQQQISPRFGLSYTLGSSAILRFSYGHFFQMPPLYALYQNSRFLIPSDNFGVVLGNPNIKAEKTVQYEFGLWQEIINGMGLELSVFYRDIYDLQSAIVVTTYNQVKYGLFSNKDYGNVKGFELKYDYFLNPISIFVNYTLQFTRGNADNPTATFSRAGQSLDEIPKLIPLSWDQRHTANISVSYSTERYGITLTGYYNSGLTYTYTPIPESPLSKQTLYPNNQHKPSTISFDLKSYYDINILKSVKVRFSLLVFNLFDQLNEISVNQTTGRAYSAIIRPTQISTFRSNYNDVFDRVRDPSMYSPPREIKFGIGFIF